MNCPQHAGLGGSWKQADATKFRMKPRDAVSLGTASNSASCRAFACSIFITDNDLLAKADAPDNRHAASLGSCSENCLPRRFASSLLSENLTRPLHILNDGDFEGTPFFTGATCNTLSRMVTQQRIVFPHCFRNLALCQRQI